MQGTDGPRSIHDFATVRVYETDDFAEVFFRFGDGPVKTAVKRLRGRWDPSRKSWRVPVTDQRGTRAVDAIRDAVLLGVPALWRDRFAKLADIACVTRRYNLAFGAGGVRIRIPSGHKHHYTLRDKVASAEMDKQEWVVPAKAFEDPVVNQVVKDVVAGDRELWGRSVDYLEGYAVAGTLSPPSGSPIRLALETGAVAFALPGFLPALDLGIEDEPVRCHPLRVLSRRDEGGSIVVDLAVLTGEAGYAAAARFARRPGLPAIDATHAEGRWRRRRTGQ